MIFVLLFLLMASPCWAAEDPPQKPGDAFHGPLLQRNDNPLYLAFGSTILSDRADTGEPGRWRWNADYLNSNTIVDQHDDSEADHVVVDAEVQRFELTLKRALTQRLEFGTAIAYVAIGSGFSDSFIESFEEGVGAASVGARDGRGENEFRYLFRVDGVNQIDRQDETIHGLTDIPLQLKFQFRDGQEGFLPRVSARGMLKLPTATDSLLGNQAVDGGVGLLAEQPAGKKLLFLGNIEVVSVHAPRPLKNLDLDPVMVSGTVGFEHRLTQRASWQLQWRGATNPYPEFNEQMTALTRTPMSIGFGWNYRLFRTASLRLTLMENLFSSDPDFAWGFSIRSER